MFSRLRVRREESYRSTGETVCDFFFLTVLVPWPGSLMQILHTGKMFLGGMCLITFFYFDEGGKNDIKWKMSSKISLNIGPV